jgi:hypothetical protein
MFRDNVKNVLWGFAKWFGFEDRANVYGLSVIVIEIF